MRKTIKIHVWRGIVSELENIPEGYKYKVIDHDVLGDD